MDKLSFKMEDRKTIKKKTFGPGGTKMPNETVTPPHTYMHARTHTHTHTHKYIRGDAYFRVNWWSTRSEASTGIYILYFCIQTYDH